MENTNAFIREYVEARGGLDVLTEEEKQALIETSRRGPPQMNMQGVPLGQYRQSLGIAMDGIKRLYGKGSVMVDKKHIDGLARAIKNLQDLKASASSIVKAGMGMAQVARR